MLPPHRSRLTPEHFLDLGYCLHNGGLRITAIDHPIANETGQDMIFYNQKVGYRTSTARSYSAPVRRMTE
jgi:hypothetical protein